MVTAKLMLIAWIVMGNEPITNVQGYEFKGQEDCMNAKTLLLETNQNVGAECVTKEFWDNIGHN